MVNIYIKHSHMQSVEVGAPILWPPDENSWLIGKDTDAGKDWRQKEKRVREDEMIGWHHWFNGHDLGQTLGDGEGQGSLVCCISWGLMQRVRHDLATENTAAQVEIQSHRTLGPFSSKTVLVFVPFKMSYSSQKQVYIERETTSYLVLAHCLSLRSHWHCPYFQFSEHQWAVQAQGKGHGLQYLTPSRFFTLSLSRGPLWNRNYSVN